MSLFGKKKEEKKESCCCGGNCNAETVKAAEESKTSGASVKILGSGCANAISLKRILWKL